jgi:hypothetical protein
MSKVSRRDILKVMSLGLGAGVSSRVFLSDVSAAVPQKHFFLYIHCGSWDGISTGLLQPNSVSEWPRGVFRAGVDFSPGSTVQGQVMGNRLVSRIAASNNHFLTHYASPLRDVTQNLVHVTCAPGSLDHNVARVIQQTGTASGQPHWISGLAQAFRDPLKASHFVVNSPYITGTTPDISNIVARDLDRFRSVFQESVESNDAGVKAASQEFAKAGASIFDSLGGPSLLPRNFKTTFEGTLEAIIRGISGVADTDPAVVSVRSAFGKANVDAKISEYFNNNDAAGIVDAEGADSLSNQFILAGSLAASGAAHGMVIQMPGEDRHFGGADLSTARMAGNLWTQLVIFWKWLEQAGIQDRVTVIVSHEFTRTAWNARTIQGSAQINGQEVNFVSPGRDHHPINGLYVLDKRIKAGVRYGGLRNGFTASGSRSLGGMPDTSVPAPTTQQALGTLFFTLFDQFRHPGQPDSARVVRAFWPTFADSDIVNELRGVS